MTDPIYTNSKAQAMVNFAEGGVAAFGTVISKATLASLNDRPTGDAFHVDVRNLLANSLPRLINQIAKTRVVATEPADDSHVVKVLIPTVDGTVNGQPVAAGTSVYTAGNSGAVVEVTHGKILEYIYTVDKPWVGPVEVEEPGLSADTPGQIPVKETKPKPARGKAKAKAPEVESIDVEINTHPTVDVVETPASITSEDGTVEVVSAETTVEDIQDPAGS